MVVVRRVEKLASRNPGASWCGLEGAARAPVEQIAARRMADDLLALREDAVEEMEHTVNFDHCPCPTRNLAWTVLLILDEILSSQEIPAVFRSEVFGTRQLWR